MTKIPWAKETNNPWVGCTKCRAGCLNCYAERLAYRLAAMGQKNYAAVLDGHKWNGKIAYQLEQLDKLKHWHKGRRVFIGSMTDIFHEAVPFVKIGHVFEKMYFHEHHTYLIATKRPGRALEFAKWFAGDKFGLLWAGHIHLLISCSTQKDLDEMAPVLFQIPAAVLGVSFEPLIENIEWRWTPYVYQAVGQTYRQYLTDKGQIEQYESLKKMKWIVVGAESGPHRRPCNIEWVRSIVRQCKEAGVAVYVKQLDINGKVVSDPKDFPEDLRIRSYPK